MMQIYNTQTRRKEEFKPIEPGKVRIYCCGPTVYNYFHIGNARPFIVFDTLRRYLEHKGYEVKYVQNFTDIDDKMIRRANEEGITVKELGDRFIKEYYTDADALGIERATVNPRATEHIADIIALIEKLIDKGLAYACDNGDVYYNTQAFPGYGKLCGQNLEDLESGARIDVDPNKRHPMDFAVWKAQKPGEPAWESPWGMGRPGWHIECSAMSMKYLGETLDIHCGGKDLVFPHHENEIAQSEGATGKPFVHYWMHNGFINVDNQKMSKSLGNFFTVRDIAKEFDLEAVRMFMLGAQYRSPINFSREMIEQAKASLDRLYTARDHYLFLLQNAKDGEPGEKELALMEKVKAAREGFDEAMDDDLNTADAMGKMFELVRDANVALDENSPKQAIAAVLDALGEMAGVFGILTRKADDGDEKVKALIEARAKARAEKNWAESDRLRDEIAALGKRQGAIILTDPDVPGTRIRQRVTELLPNAKHAFIARKDACHPVTGKAGVEYAAPETILRALEKAYATSDAPEVRYTLADLMRWGLAGAAGSAARRERFCETLALGHANSKTLLKRLNSFGVEEEIILEALAELEADNESE